MVRKIGGIDHGRTYAMKIVKKERVMQKEKTLEHTLAERSVLEKIRECPFLTHLKYAFQSESKLHLVMGKLLIEIFFLESDSKFEFI